MSDQLPPPTGAPIEPVTPAIGTPKVIVWAFILSLAGFFILTALAAVAMVLTNWKKVNAAGKGKGLAIAALVISGFWIVLILLALLVPSTDSDSEASGPSTQAVEAEVSEAPEAAVVPAPPSPEPDLSDGLQTVAEMCNLLIAQSAPVPPTISVTAARGPATWSQFLLALNDYFDVIKNDIDQLVTQDNSQEVRVANSSLAKAAFDTSLVTLGLRLEPPSKLTAQEIETGWAEIQSSLESMCPQWQGSAWPYAGDPTPVVAPKKFRKLTDRQWAKIAKNPEAANGESVVVYGVITQFDAATGPAAFRAEVSGTKKSNWFDYNTNTFLLGTEDMLADLVADDFFQANVTVEGAYTYETTLGGSITVPQLRVESIKRTGSR